MRPLLLLLILCGLQAAVSIDGPATASGIVGSPFSVQISASGGAPLAYGAAPLPAGLVLNPVTGIISGTPSAAATTSVTISATSGAGSASMTLDITVAAPGSGGFPANAGPVTVTVGSACSYLLTSASATAAFTAANLPAGLTISATGLVSGTPTTAGIANASISCDADVTSTSMAFTVLAARSGAPTVSLSVQPQAAVGAGFGCWLEAPGADSYACTALPVWLQLDGNTGALSGTPPAGAAGTNLQLTIAAGAASTSTVLAIPVTTPTSAGQVPQAPVLVDGTVGCGVGWKVVAAEATVLSAANLPGGLDLDASSGLLVGTPISSGIFNAIVTSTPGDPAVTVSTTCGMRIRAAISGAPVIGDLLPPLLTVGIPAAIAIPGTGPAATRYTLSGGAGYAIDANGIITGTPTAAGQTSLRITAINDMGSAVTTLMLQSAARLAAAPARTSPALLRATAGSAYAAALFADAEAASWSVVGLPAALTAAPFTGIITGVPAAVGSSNVAVSPNDADGGNPGQIVVAVDAAASGAPAIGDAGPWTVGTGQPVRIPLRADVAAIWTANGLPAGLAVSARTIAGSSATAGWSNLTLTARAGSASASTGALLIVQSTPTGAPVFRDPGILQAVVATPFTGSISANGAPDDYAVAGGPPWLVVDAATGALSGTPTDAGTWVLAISATNANGTARTAAVLEVLATAPGPGVGSDPAVGGVSGGCGAGAAGLLLAMIPLLRRRR